MQPHTRRKQQYSRVSHNIESDSFTAARARFQFFLPLPRMLWFHRCLFVCKGYAKTTNF